MIIDSHFHPLSMAKRGITELPEDIIGIAVATDSGDIAEMTRVLPLDRRIFISAGAGPWVLNEELFISPEDEIERVRKEIAEYPADAIGECGIDNHWKYGTPELQMELFLREADLAAELDLPLIIHSRDADKEIAEALSSGHFRANAVMHCFSSGPDMARFVLDKGLFISFSGNITYKGNEAIRQAAMIVPDDRILVETDAPYLAPIPYRGRPNRPEYTEATLEMLASLRHQDKNELKNLVAANLHAFLKRDESIRKLRSISEN